MLVLAVMWIWEKAQRNAADREARLQLAFANNVKKERDLALDATIRAEKTLKYYKLELGHVQAELASCIVPGSVRHRLNRLQSGTADST
jgi:hypothetical protein